MKIAHISDLHFTRISWNPFRLFPKRLIGNLNWLLRRKGVFSRDQLDPLIDLLNELKVDLVLIGGDLTSTALHREFQEASRFISRLPSPKIVIPGNHDHYTRRSFRHKHFYSYFTNPKPLTEHTLRNNRIELHTIHPDWHLIALDTAQPAGIASAAGIFSKELEKNLEEVLQAIPKDHSVIILNHYPFFRNDIPRHSLTRGEALEKLIKKHKNIRLYLHGHTHRHTIADLQMSGLPVILDSGCVADTSQATWNLIELADSGCHVDAYHWDQRWEKKQRQSFTWQ